MNGGHTRGSQGQRRSSSPHRSTRRPESGDTDPSPDRPSAIRAEGANSSNGSSSTFLASTYRPLEKTTDVYHRDRNAEGTAQVRPIFEVAQLNVPSQKSTGLISKGKGRASARASVPLLNRQSRRRFAEAGRENRVKLDTLIASLRSATQGNV